MTLEQSLSQKKTAILDKWFRLIIETYPSDSSGFLRREKDQFANPVGNTISREIVTLYDELLHDMNLDNISTSLDSIIRIRSVQDFTPSQATNFVFLLKKVIREELLNDLGRNLAYDDLLRFEARIDEMAFLALDVYTKCRDKIWEIRLNEAKAEGQRALRLLEISRIIYSKSEIEQLPEDGEDQLP